MKIVLKIYKDEDNPLFDMYITEEQLNKLLPILGEILEEKTIPNDL